MYNKLFAKILDSSVWLESDTTRLVWITLIAAMDRDGFAPFAAVANVANRARVDLDATRVAISTLESPDIYAPDQEHEGRRIERVSGGWMVINAAKYRDIVSAAIAREQTRERVRRHREAKRNVTPSNDLKRNVTPSETATAVQDLRAREAPPVSPPAASTVEVHNPSGSSSSQQPDLLIDQPGTEVQTADRTKNKPTEIFLERFNRFWAAYPNKDGKKKAIAAWMKLHPSDALTDTIVAAVEAQKSWSKWTRGFIPLPTSWLNAGGWENEPPAPSAVESHDPRTAGNAAAMARFIARGAQKP